MPRSGEVGEQIFEQVEKLVAGGMNRTEAFAKISEESGRRAGTVAANYYRVARKRAGGSLRPRRAAAASGGRRRAASAGTTARGRGRRRRASTTAGSSELDGIANALVDNIQALTRAVKDQSRQVEELRSRLDGIRKLLD